MRKKDTGSAGQPSTILTKTQQRLVEDIKRLGRLPKLNRGSSEEDKCELKLRKRCDDHMNSLPPPVIRLLQGGYFQPNRISETLV